MREHRIELVLYDRIWMRENPAFVTHDARGKFVVHTRTGIQESHLIPKLDNTSARFGFVQEILDFLVKPTYLHQGFTSETARGAKYVGNRLRVREFECPKGRCAHEVGTIAIIHEE